MSFMTEADAHYAHEKGRDRPDLCWILSDRDVWYRNPYYIGPDEPHPEDYQHDEICHADESYDYGEEPPHYIPEEET